MSQVATFRQHLLRKPAVGAIWALTLVIICTVVAFNPTTRTVYMYFSDAGRDWLASNDCYAERGGYRYSPTMSVAFVPFGMMPNSVGAVLWRLLSAAAVIGAFFKGCRTIDVNFASRSASERAWLWLLLLPLSIGNLYNGQSNLMLTALCMIGVSAAIEQRWNVAAAALAATCFFKAYPVSMALLVCTVAPLKFGPRFALAIAIGAIVPFAAQRPEYVIFQYQAWLREMIADNRFHPTLGTSYRDLSQLLGNVGMPITRGGFFVIQCAAAAAAGALCAWARWGLHWSPARCLRMCYFLATFWMMLCGPATESSTYIFLSPAAAWLAVDAYCGRTTGISRWCALAGWGFVHAALLSSAFPFGGMVHGWGFHPLGALLLLIGYLCTELTASEHAGTQSPALRNAA